MPTIEEIIAEVPADGPSGKVGMATAERIVAALKASPAEAVAQAVAEPEQPAPEPPVIDAERS